MKTPHLLISAALLFWGWLTGFILLAAFLAIILECSLFITSKWDFSESDFNHITDLCVLILVSIYVYNAIDDPKTTAYQVMKFLPCIAFPLIAAQRYCITGTVHAKSLFSIMRKYVQLDQQGKSVDVSYPYLILCLIASGAANSPGHIYYAGVLILGGCALFATRVQRYSKRKWLLLIMFCIVTGWSGNIGIEKLQQIITQYAQGFFNGIQDPFKTRTSIGEIGEQKMHNYILFRVTPDPNEKLPLLLREASYNSYLTTSWVASESPLEKVASPIEYTWNLTDVTTTVPLRNMQVKQYTKDTMAMLKLPLGARGITNLAADKLKKNGLGAVMIEDGESYINYDISYSKDSVVDEPPNHFDLEVPKVERPALRTIIDELQLNRLPASEVISKIENYFDSNFSYTLNHTGQGERETPLAHFLLDRKAGHCELFATATVLLLRECGIPARYAIGYSASEYSYLEEQIVVRHRHGHAWTLVFVNNTWQNLDTTSSNWLDYEEEQVSPLEYIWDLFAYIRVRFAEINWRDPVTMSVITILMLIVLAIMIRRRLKGKKKTQRVKIGQTKEKLKLHKKGIDSPFYMLEQAIAEHGYARHRDEALTTWSTRVQKAAPALLNYDELHSAIQLHYQLRFTDLTEFDNMQILLTEKVDAIITTLNSDQSK